MADGKRPSTEDDESVEFSFPIMHTEESFIEDEYLHPDSYGHQSRVTPERSMCLEFPLSTTIVFIISNVIDEVQIQGCSARSYEIVPILLMNLNSDLAMWSTTS